MNKPDKLKKCKICPTMFKPFNSLQVVCGVVCAAQLTNKQNEAKAKKEMTAFKRETRSRKIAMKSKAKWLQEAQAACNAYIRERDKDEPCISCGRYDHDITESFRGGKWDAGHFKSRGAYPELRFHHLNIHKQCKSCNGGSGKYAKKSRTVAQDYEERLIGKIGGDMVDWLNGEQKIQNLVIDDIAEIKQYYKEQLKLLQQGQA